MYYVLYTYIPLVCIDKIQNRNYCVIMLTLIKWNVLNLIVYRNNFGLI